MMKRFYYILAASVLLFAGCQNEIDENAAVNPSVFTATIDSSEPATRTLLGAATTAGRDVLWKDGDELIVGGKTYVAGSLTDEGRTATLSPKVATELAQKNAADKYEAYYPTSIYNGGSRALPAVQYYELPTAADGNLVVASHLPMYAESAGTTLQFKNLCAVLNFQLTGADKVTKVVVTSATKKLSGAIASIAWSDGDPVLTMDATASNTVTLDCGTSGIQLNATTPIEFCIALPPATYDQNDLTVEVFGTGSTTTPITTFKNAAATGSQLERSKIYDISKSAKQPFSVTYKGVTTSSTGTPVVASSSINNIPESETTPYLFTHEFTVSSDRGYKVTITDGTVAFTDKLSDPASGGTVTMTVAAGRAYRLGGTSEFRREARFSVSATQQVCFSPGNLQFRAKRADGVSTYDASNTFRFAEHQYDVVGSYGAPTVRFGNVFADVPSSGSNGFSTNYLIGSEYTGWIDLLGWGTSGKIYGAARYMPYEYGGDYIDYGPSSGNLSVSGDSDWGAADIWDGNNLVPGGTYRTLDVTEWQYLVEGRNVLQTGWCSSKVSFKATSPDNRTFQITFEAYDDPSTAVTYNISTVLHERWWGLLIFPDNFSNTGLISRAGLTYGGSHYNHFVPDPQVVDVALWPEFERAGCVFLPAPSAMRGWDSINGILVLSDPDRCVYWTSRRYDIGSSQPFYAWNFEPSQDFFKTSYKRQGLAVRLVKDVTP